METASLPLPLAAWRGVAVAACAAGSTEWAGRQGGAALGNPLNRCGERAGPCGPSPAVGTQHGTGLHELRFY